MSSGRRAGACVVALVALCAASLAGCSSDGGSQHKVYTIGILRSVAGSGNQDSLFDGLHAAGIEQSQLRVLGGKDTEIHADDADVEATLRRWHKRGLDLVVALSTRTALVAAEVTPSTPVIVLSTDPAATGLVKDERHPEGNITGSTYRVPADRTLALVADAFPDLEVKRVGCLQPAADPAAAPARAALDRGAAALHMQLVCATFATVQAVPDAVRQVLDAQVDVIVLVNAPTTSLAFPQLRFVLSKTHVPVIANQPADFAVITLSPDSKAVYRTMGRQAARLLTGTPVRDVPVEDPGRFVLSVNLRAAARIGRTVSKAVVDGADQVVEN